MIFIIDIDGTICNEILNEDGSKDYQNHTPIKKRIAQVNKLYDEGHTINFMTARGAKSGIDHRELTERQLADWGIKYHALSVGEKPHYDKWIDDKAYNAAILDQKDLHGHMWMESR